MNENSSNKRNGQFDEIRERRQERRALRGSSGWIGGAMLVLLGILLLGQNIKILSFENWWALFIFLPALGSFGTAWRIIQEAGGRFTARARNAVIVGMLFILVASIFLFSLNWMIYGPALLVLAGLGLLVNSILPD